MITQQRPASEKKVLILMEGHNCSMCHLLTLWYFYGIITSKPPPRLFFPVSVFETVPRPAVFTLYGILDSVVPYQVGPYTTQRSADHASRGKMQVAALEGGL